MALDLESRLENGLFQLCDFNREIYLLTTHLIHEFGPGNLVKKRRTVSMDLGPDPGKYAVPVTFTSSIMLTEMVKP